MYLSTTYILMPIPWKKEQRIMNAIARKRLRSISDEDIIKAKQEIASIEVGRPALYSNPDEMQILIEEYIEEQSKKGKPLTITGLAIKLGMDRRNLLEYNKKDEFYPIINKYRQVLLSSVEENLTDKASFTPGQIFYLKNNFKEDYQDKIEVENKHTHSVSLRELYSLAERLEDNSLEGEVLEGEVLPDEEYSSQ